MQSIARTLVVIISLLLIDCDNGFVRYGSIDLAIVYEENGSVEIAIDNIELARRYDFSLEEICKHINIKKPESIKIIIHNGVFKKHGYTFTTGGFADSGRSTIEYNLCFDKYGEILVDRHELVHIVFNVGIGHARSRLIAEGYAVAIDDYFGESYGGQSIKEAIKTLPYSNIETLLSDNGSMEEAIYYPLAGSFIKWIIHRFGMEKAKEIYGSACIEDFSISNIEYILGIEVEYIEKEYREYFEREKA